jgi:glycosyltransferase involved in cell wall biosynthesis
MGGDLRVLHVLGELRASGAETMLRAAGTHFAAHGVDSHILATGAAIGEYAPRLADAGYALHHIPFEPATWFFPRLLAFLATHRYDVVHVHAERASFWTTLTAFLSGHARVIRTVHNNFQFDSNLRVRREIQRRLLAGLGVRYVSISTSVARNEKDRYRIETVLIPNWFDSDHFRPPSSGERTSARRALGYAPDDRLVVSVGNCNPAKNHGAILEALARIPVARRPRYLHVGGEEPGCPERALATQLGVAEHVRFLGSLPDAREALWAADAYVMPSRFEGFSIAALEALAVGLPAIVSDAPGLRDLREWFPELRLVRDVDDLTAALAGDVSAAADQPARARAQFGCAAGVDLYVALYREVAA